MTRVNYPTGGYTDYNYSYYAQEGGCYKDGGFIPYETEYRKYHVINQAVHTPSLAKNTVYSYQGDFDGITQTTVTMKNEQNSAQSYHEFDVNSNGLATSHTIYDTSWNELVRTDYTHSSRKEVLQKNVYKQGVYCYTEKFLYDSWGNIIYQENGEGEKVYTSYANTNYSKIFRDYTGNIGEFSSIFYDNNIQSTIHTALIGSARIQGDKTIETYCQHDSKGHIVDMRQLFYGTINSSTFQDTFDESGSTSFLIDLTGVTLQGDATLKIQGVPHTNYETKTETHSKYKYCNWLNDGYWQGRYFYAEYVTKQWPPQQGYEPVGPFDHYPGTPGYQSYTKWVSAYTQYVKTTYNEYTDKYPEKVEYNLNGGTWKVLSTHLGGKKVYCSIPAEEFISGENTLYFRESSSWTTEFEWVLYVPHAVSPIEDVSTSFVYDGYGNVISITDSLNNTTTLGYDTQYYAYLTTITNALNNTTTATYDLSRGFLTSITDAKMNTTSFEYDILGRVTKKINPDLTELEAVYDDENNVTTIYDELDNYMKRYYDGVGRLIKQEWYLTDTMKLTEIYDQTYLNKLKTRTDPEGDVYTYEYDPLGRMTKIFNPDSSYREFQYTDITNIIYVFDENQHKTEYQYNWAGRLLQVKEYTDAANYYLTEYTYDSSGHLTSFTDANGNTTGYEYNSLFGVTGITYSDLTTVTFVYDAAGNLIQKTDASGTTTFAYDDIYQLLNVQYPDQSMVSYQYDENGNRISMTDPEGSTSYTFNERNQLLSQTRTILGDQYTMSYQYDAASQLISITYPDQTIVDYEYDSLNRMINIPGYAQFTYSNSLLSSALFANGVETSYQYNNRDRPTTLHAVKDTTDTLIMNYQYDPVGNITQLEYNKRLPDQTWEQSVETFSYDWLDRLISAQGEYGSLSYTYDPVGNRLSRNDTTYAYNVMNELTSTSDGTVFTYDEKGNVISKANTDTWSYTYQGNTLTEVEKNQQTLTEYTYDGDGKRITKTEWIEDLQEYHTKIYVYSGLQVVYEKNATTGQEASYVYGPAGKIAKNVNIATDFYHTDHLGSTRLITDENGDVLTTVEYNPFGEDTTTGEKESYAYTGKEKDSSGLYYYGARYYDPEIGRFISRDFYPGKPSNPQTLNRYTYVLNNPLKYRDPDGLEQAGALVGNGDYAGLPDVEPMGWSQAPQLIGEYSSGSPLALLSMLLLVTIICIPGVQPSLLAPLVEKLIAAGAQVAQAILAALKAYAAWRAKHPVISFFVELILGSIAFHIIVNALEELIDLCKDLLKIAAAVLWSIITGELGEKLGFMLTFFNDAGEPICGHVFLPDEDYSWKVGDDGAFYVHINGQWVKMPDDWEPGDPIPP
jgi:RHS repeat-associated protein